MRVLPLTVGPILGATAASQCRIWGRADYQSGPAGPRRAFGVARIRQQGARARNPVFFKMNPNFDMTGVVVFDKLKPATAYQYQIGYFYSDGELEDFRARNLSLEWDDAHTVSFTTGTDDAQAARSFILGSCRYLLRLFGGSWFDDRGDKTFRSVLAQIDDANKPRRTDAVLMVGDQIYADDLNIVGADRALDDYYTRYRDVFSQPNVRELMSRIPTYMTLDDHEIEDNWPADASQRDWVTKYPAAIHAYQTYQLSHSPLFDTADTRIEGTPEKIWYTFHDGCCDFFTLDTRTERFLGKPSELISRMQMDALKGWLTDGSGRVKFVVSSVPLFPDSLRENSDKWGGFIEQRDELLQHVFTHHIRKVVFLSGDIHCSLASELQSPQDRDFKIVSLISSSFFWPYPHSRGSDYQLEGRLKSRLTDTFNVVRRGDVYSTDNFSRVTVRPEGLDFEVFARKGEPLGSTSHAF